MDVSVIIVNYNTEELLRQCVDSIVTCTQDIDYEIIVVDNGSKDNSLQMLHSTYPQVITIENGANLGFGVANNIGARRAKGDYLFILNSDTIFLNNALSYFTKFMREYILDGSIGAVGALMVNQKREAVLSFSDFPSVSAEINYVADRLKGRKRSLDEYNSKAQGTPFTEVGFVIGADLFVPRDVFEKLNGFDPDFFVYYEEIDLQKRMERAALRRVVIPEPLIIHLEGGSTKAEHYSFPHFSLIQKGLNRYICKHFNGLHYILFTAVIILIRSTIIFSKKLTPSEKWKALYILFAQKK